MAIHARIPMTIDINSNLSYATVVRCKCILKQQKAARASLLYLDKVFANMQISDKVKLASLQKNKTHLTIRLELCYLKKAQLVQYKESTLCAVHYTEVTVTPSVATGLPSSQGFTRSLRVQMTVMCHACGFPVFLLQVHYSTVALMYSVL